MKFTDVIAGLRADTDGWIAQAPADWGQGRTLFGGLQAAFLVAAMRELVGTDIPLRSLQCVFIGPVTPGEVRVQAKILRQGKSTIHAEAQIASGQGLGCTAIAVFGHSRTSKINIRLPTPEVDRPVEASPLQPIIEGVSPPFLCHVEQRWSRGAMPYCGGDQAQTQVYVRYFEESLVNESLVIAFADTIPSPAVSILNSFSPASSMCWTLEFLRDDLSSLPVGDWLMDAQVTAAADGYVYQTAHLWSPDMQAVAISRQSAVVFG